MWLHKIPLFLCYWDSRDRKSHCIKQHWQPRQTLSLGDCNIVNEPLVDRSRILLPPLHIKLGLMKQFVTALDCESRAFHFLMKKFPKISEAKVKEGEFNGPDIGKLLHAIAFEALLQYREVKARRSFLNIVSNFLGSHKSNDFEDIIKDSTINFHNMGCNMSVKLHFLASHLTFSHRIWQISARNTENDFTRIYR